MAEGSVKFGNLLVKLELISESDLEDALRIAPQSGMPLGKTLVLLRRLSEPELQVAVELQSLINQQNYPIDLAKKITKLVRSGLSPSMALKQLSFELAPTETTTIGQLLLEANVLTQTQLDDAQRASYQSGMRLGRMLVLKGIIDTKELENALKLQGQVRNKDLARNVAIEKLSKVHAAKAMLPEQSKNKNESAAPRGTKQVRFNEFIVSSGLATETEMFNALQASFDDKLSLGDAIVQMGLLSQRVYDIALDLYTKVSAGELAFHDATDRMHKTVFGDPEHGHGGTTPVLGELLKMTELVTDNDIAEAIALSSKYPSVIGKMLVLSGAIDEATLIASLRCQFLLKNGYLRLEDAIKALKHSSDHKMSFDDSLEELGLRRHDAVRAEN